MCVGVWLVFVGVVGCCCGVVFCVGCCGVGLVCFGRLCVCVVFVRMGNKAGKSKSAGSGKIAVDSDEFWWAEAAKTLAPIEGCDEFCKRFNTFCF